MIRTTESDTIIVHSIFAFASHGSLNGEARVDPDKPRTPRVENEPLRKARARLLSIGTQLRRMWDDIVQEPIPEEMRELLRKLDEIEREKGGTH